MGSALVHISGVDVHEIRPSYGYATALCHVHLNCNVRDVLLLGAGGGLDLDQVELLPVDPDKDVDPRSDALEGKGRFVQDWDGGVRQQSLR